MNGFVALNNLLLVVVSTVPIVVFSTALTTLLAYWFFVGRHSPSTTPEQEVDALRIMQGIRVGLSLRNHVNDITPTITTTTEEL